MSSIDKETVEKLAVLCKICLSETEKEMLLSDLGKIVSYVGQLDEVDTHNTDPCAYVTEAVTQTPLREDVASNTLTTKDFLANAAKSTGGMVRVPNVLKQ